MKTNVSSQTRIGKISYVNTLPFYHGLECEGNGWLVAEGSPTELNRLIHEDRLDLAPISSLEYAHRPGRYLLLPDLCIGAMNFSGSVLLLSKRKIEELNGRAIAISNESYSSQALLKILLQKKYQFENVFAIRSGDPHQMLNGSEACLVIGDRALFFDSEEFVYKYDLSELWYDWAQKPFCFSVWAVRRSYVENHQEEVESFRDSLKENTVRNLENLSDLIQSGMKLSMADPQFAKVYSYLKQLRYEFDDQMRDGLLHFFRLAHELGIVEHRPELQYVKGRSE